MIHAAIRCHYSNFPSFVALSSGTSRELSDFNDFIAGLSRRKNSQTDIWANKIGLERVEVAQ